jgi:hypothetical protein
MRIDRERTGRLLRMNTSLQPGEALEAVRRAFRQSKEEGTACPEFGLSLFAEAKHNVKRVSRSTAIDEDTARV